MSDVLRHLDRDGPARCQVYPSLDSRVDGSSCGSGDEAAEDIIQGDES